MHQAKYPIRVVAFDPEASLCHWLLKPNENM